MSNSENILLPDKDLNSMRSFVKHPVRRGPIRNSLQNRQLIAHQPTSSCRIESNSSKRKRRKQPEREGDDSGAEEKENICTIGADKPFGSNGENKADQDSVDENDDGFRTPTSLDQKIPAIPRCPPPPMKPKPPPSMKRRAPRRRVLLDLSNEIELLFPPADLGKKSRQANQ